MIPRLALCFLALGLAGLLPAQEGRLSNLSIRAQGGGGDALVTGFTIGPGQAKTVLIRAVGPTLETFGVSGTLADPKLVLYNGAGARIAENDDFNASDAPAFASVGAFQLAPGGKDAALVATLAPGGYTVEVNGVGAARGVALVEVYEMGGGSTRLINLSTRAQVGTGDGILIPGITISAGNSSRRLLIRVVGPTLGTFGVPGALADPKLELFSGTTLIGTNDNWETAVGTAVAAGPQLASIFTQAGAFTLASGSKDAALLANLGPGNYTLQVSGVNAAIGEALVEVYDLSEPAGADVRPNANVYFAALRPGPNSGASLASGFAAITFNPDGTARVTVNISNLSSAQSSAYLRLAGTNDYILSLPIGQVAERPWVIGPVGFHTRNDIVRALNEGRVYVSLETAKYPGGEVAGTLVSAAGSRTFTPPAAPPALPAQILNSPSDLDAARLLIQATFGPTDATITEVKRLGVNEWIRAQMALPATSLLAGLRDDTAKFPNPLKNPQGMEVPRLDMFFNHNVVWWKQVMTAPDQLRQRVAFALSEIFVISTDEQSRTEPSGVYYDLLVNGAFGNFRTLLEQVSTNPEMGWYLTFLRNRKADPVRGTSPDENYAREIQQLFTVGLVQLQPDGTLLLDADGQPIPTYDNLTITETAKVFTGWAYQNRADNFFSDPAYDGTPGGFDHTKTYLDTNGRMLPMKCYEAHHDKTEKRVISLQQAAPRVAPPTIIAANQTGPQDLKVLLDTLFNHPNTGPFISKLLIQRLVTSNPSAGYVYRVARAFADNGRGVRGDLGAVVTAILTDYEARSPEAALNVGFGKIKEPLLRLTALLRVMKTAAPNGRFADSYYYDPRATTPYYPVGFFSNFNAVVNSLGQAAYHSPSVFNFFSPFYSAPGLLADSGLVAPELQILDSTYAIKAPNQLIAFIYKEPPTVANAPTPSPFLRNDFTDLLALSGDASALVERLNLLLSGGQLSAATKAVVLEVVAGVIPPTPLNNTGTPTRFAINTTNSPMIAPRVAAFDPTGSFTMETWIFPVASATPFATWIMGKLGDTVGDPFRNYSVVVNGPGNALDRLQFSVSTAATGSYRSATSPAAIPLGAWMHVAAVLDGVTLRLYLNGQQVATGTALGPPKSEPSAPFSIGAGIRSSGANNFSTFNGYISQPRFWSVARSAAQIATGMNEAVPSDRTGLVAGWLLDEGAGATAADYGASNYALQRPETVNVPAVGWVATNGQSLDRVQTALHLIIASPDAAHQK